MFEDENAPQSDDVPVQVKFRAFYFETSLVGAEDSLNGTI